MNQLSEKRSYRKRTAKEKAEIVLAGLRGDTSVRDVCREYESQTFIESWFRYLKERVIWRNEFETMDQARAAIGAYVDHYHDRPHSGLDYRTPKEVRQTWGGCPGSVRRATGTGGLTCQREAGAVHLFPESTDAR